MSWVCCFLWIYHSIDWCLTLRDILIRPINRFVFMRRSFSGLKMVKMSVFKPHGFSTMCCSLSLSLYLNMRVYIPSLHSDHSTLLFNTVQINHNVSASVWKEPVASGQVTHYEVRSAGQGWVSLVLVTLSSRLFSVHNSAQFLPDMNCHDCL